MAGYADEGAEVAVEFEGWEERVGEGVEGVDVLGYDAPEHSHFSQVSDSPVRAIGTGFVEVRPS